MAAILDMIQIGTPVLITMSFWKAINAAHGSASATIVAAYGNRRGLISVSGLLL